MLKQKIKFLPLLLILVMAFMSVGCGTKIPAGHRGVFFATFGDGIEYGRIYGEGFNWHLPWNEMNVFKIQLQERKENLTVLSSDGATIRMDVSILFRPTISRLDSLLVEIGEDYYNIKVSPTIRGIARGIAGRYKPEEIYSTKREEMNKAIEEG